MDQFCLASLCFKLLFHFIILLIFEGINKGFYPFFGRMLCSLGFIFMKHPLVSFVYRKFPLFGLKMCQWIWKMYDWIFKNRILFLMFTYQVYWFVAELKRPLIDRVVKWIDHQSLFSSTFLSLSDLWDLNEECFQLAMTFFQNKGNKFLKSTLKRVKENHLAIQKEFCYSLWDRVIQAEMRL